MSEMFIPKNCVKLRHYRSNNCLYEKIFSFLFWLTQVKWKYYERSFERCKHRWIHSSVYSDVSVTTTVSKHSWVYWFSVSCYFRSKLLGDGSFDFSQMYALTAFKWPIFSLTKRHRRTFVTKSNLRPYWIS